MLSQSAEFRIETGGDTATPTRSVWLLAAIGMLIAGCGRFGFGADASADADAVARCTDTFEPNDTTATATPLALGATVDAVLCPDNVDVYVVTLAGGDEIVAELVPAGPGWPTLEIRDNNGVVRAGHTLEGTLAGFADHDGTYHVTVAGISAVAGTPYQLSVALRGERHLFVAPTGNDADPGTFAQPWKTFPFAIGRLVAGDVLVLADGVYTPANNGWLDADCSAGAANGTESQPIRVTALTERRAEIDSDGTGAAARIGNCSWWIVEGLHLENQDRQPSTGGSALAISSASNITVRRVLAAHNNRYVNAQLIEVAGASSNVLVEECETYDFHRYGIQVWDRAQDVTFRRNFSNSRGRADIAGGYTSSPADKGDGGIDIGPSMNALAENNIEEGNGYLFILAYDPLDIGDAHLFGNVTRDNDFGLRSIVLNVTMASYNRRTRVENHVSIDSRYVGYYIGTNDDFACIGCTTIGSATDGWVADNGNPQPASSSCTGCLSIGSTGWGFNVANQDTWKLDHVNAFGNGSAFSPAGVPEIVSPSEIDPMLGGCLVYLPASSPMRGAGPSGIDIGAQVVYRYRDGVLTGLPLWDPETGAFPCGAVVPGVNDDPSTSCIGVHERLHVGTADCQLPYPAP